MNELIFIGWVWHPSVVIGFALWTGAYVLVIRQNKLRQSGEASPTRWQQLAFHSGTLLGLLALVSPLDSLGDGYLFSAHMIQHLLLMFIVAPLWLLGTPGWLLEKTISKRIENVIRWVTKPVPAFAIFIGAMTLWHVPALFDLALKNEAIHIVEHFIFIAAALIGWWPVMAAENSIAPPHPPQAGMLYLFLLAVPMTAISAVLTFSSTPLYPYYARTPLAAGLSVLEDQRLGGLLMWVPAHMVILFALGFTFYRLMTDEEKIANQELFTNSTFRS